MEQPSWRHLEIHQLPKKHVSAKLSCQLSAPSAKICPDLPRAKGQGGQIRTVYIQSLIEAMAEDQTLQVGQVHQLMVEVVSEA